MSTPLETAHTPGPWRADRHNADFPGGGWFITNANGILIGKVHDGVIEVERDQFIPTRLESCDANARLIAAAPELLAACEKALAAYFKADQFEAQDVLEAAIKKAKGQ